MVYMARTDTATKFYMMIKRDETKLYRGPWPGQKSFDTNAHARSVCAFAVANFPVSSPAAGGGPN